MILCFAFFYATFITQVNLMVLKGPALTKYDPCGLGILDFDKVTDSVWKGVVHLASYPKLSEFNIRLRFDQPVSIYAHLDTSNQSEPSKNHYLMIKPEASSVKKYTFFINKCDNYSIIPELNEISLNGITLCNNTNKASHTVESFDVSDNKKDGYEHVCGRRSWEHTEVVSVRTEAKAGDWPWHVAVFTKSLYECGGSIVSRVAIVTAGHCVSKKGIVLKPNEITVVAGISNLKEPQIGRQTQTAKHVILHPSYSNPVATADLAIVKINKLSYSEFVQPICIWGPVYEKSTLVGMEGLTAGFGKTENNTFSDTLRSSYIMIQNDSVCIDSSPKVYTPLMNEFTLCAGYGPTSGINPHNGDSGGGLIFPITQPDHKISWFLRAVFSKCGTSTDRPGCNPKFYVVYTDVAPYYGWLYHHSGLQYRNNIL